MNKFNIIKQIIMLSTTSPTDLKIDITDPQAITSLLDFPYTFTVTSIEHDICFVTGISGDGDVVVDNLPVSMNVLHKKPLQLILAYLQNKNNTRQNAFTQLKKAVKAFQQVAVEVNDDLNVNSVGLIETCDQLDEMLFEVETELDADK